MRFNIERNYLILGSIAIVCGMIVAFWEPVGGALMAALGGIGMQMNFEREEVKVLIPTVPEIKEKISEIKRPKKEVPKP